MLENLDKGAMNTLDFLQAILPEHGIHYLALFKEGYKFPAHKVYTDLEKMADAIDDMAGSKSLSIYHACATYERAVVEVKEGEKTRHKYRIPENWHRAKSFWVDIDCGEEKHAKGQGYLTKYDAAVAIDAFCAKIGWPEPMLVDSGNGLHAYWPLTKDISHNAWVTHAKGLKATLHHCGVIADPTRTADFASILRPAGSVNRKNGEAKPVAVERPGTPTEPAELASALQKYMVENGVKLIKETPKREFVSNGLNDDLIAHLPQYSDLPVDANMVAEKCAQVAAMRDTQGDVGYEHWRGVIGILKHCENGETFAEQWSARREETGHAQLDWDMRYESWSAGPTTCEFFETNGCGACEGCPMRGKIKTPLVLGRMNDGVSTTPVVSRSILLEALPDWYRNKDGIPTRPMQTTANTLAAMELFGWDAPRYNTMIRRTELTKSGLDNDRHDQYSTALVLLGDDLLRAGMSREGLHELVEAIAGKNSYHPCKEWIESLPWDGVSRLKRFHDTLELADASQEFLKQKLLDAWMLQGIGALFEPEGIAAQGVLTLVAPQARNKTRFVASMCPIPGAVRTGMHIDPLSKDSVFAATGAWITEAGELDTTTRKSDAGALKAFFTRDKDVLRPAYARVDNVYKRRTVFVGTVNGTGFLHDTTGNRRYWTIEVNKCNLLPPGQMQQVWAEYLYKYQQGERWFLDDATQAALNHSNLDYTATEPLRDLIAGHFDWQSVQWSVIDPSKWRDYPEVAWLSATAVCKAVGYTNVSRPEATRAGAIIRELQKLCGKGFTSSKVDICRHSNGSKLHAVPKALAKRS